ncbi:MAG: hypothetical protein WBA67_06005, partial [Jannaschia sp.]
MIPQIALDLSLDGITVLSRAPDGGWWREGTVRLDLADMPSRLTALRTRAEERVGPDFISILILPDSQLLYTSLERDDRRPEQTIRALLKGRTPYPVEDLTFDFIKRGDRLQVAVVAIETLLEAETFAADYGFRPVALVANPKDPAYPGIPSFGLTGVAAEILQGATLDLDLADGFTITAAPPMPKPQAPEPEPVPDTPQQASDIDVSPPQVMKSPVRTSAPVADLPPSPTVVSEPTPVFASPRRAREDGAQSGPVLEKPTAPPVPATKTAPYASTTGFATSRVSAPEVPTLSGERLSRVTPRLTATPVAPPRASKSAPLPSASAPPPAPDVAPDPPKAAKPEAPARKDAAATEAPPRPAAANGPVPEKQDATSGTAPSPIPGERRTATAGAAARRAAGGLGSVAAKLRRKVAEVRPDVTPSPEVAARQAEAQALALPGIAREKAAAPPRSSARLGLVLTLGLLVVLALVGLVSVVIGPSETAGPDRSVEAIPEVAALPPVTGPEPADDADTDLAALLPRSDSAPASVLPDLSAPTLQDADQTALGLADEGGPEILSEDQLLPDVAPDLALAPTIETTPTLDTTSATFTERFVAEGIFDAPPTPESPAPQDVDDIYIASIDPVISATDAVALPAAQPPTDGIAIQTNPAPAGTVFATDAGTGLVEPTPEGTLAPGGYRVVTGRPDVLPVQRPTDTPSTATQDAVDTEAENVLRRTRPVPRPDDAAE